MRKNRIRRGAPRGVSLVEAMVAVGVLAVIVPLALGAIVQAGGIGNSARAETRAPAIAELCLAELEAARQGRSAYFDKIGPDPVELGGSEVLALAFGRDGGILGKLSKAQYDSGLKEFAGEEVLCVARMTGSQVDPEPAGLLTITVKVEYPATKPSGKRDVVPFHTKLP